jgi:hypothetical protein
MSGRIHFVSGKTLDISDIEFRNISPKLGAKGIRCQVSQQGHVIPLNSTTIEYIELIPEEEELTEETKEEKVIEKKEEDNGLTPEEKQKKAYDELMAKSNCEHPNQTLYIQRTAKGVRYFPVCDFCGKRERYVSEKKVRDGEYEEWKDEDVDNAKPWIES